MTPRALILRALDALADGELGLVRACLEEADAILEADANRWVTFDDVPLVPDLSVLPDGMRPRR